MPPAKKFNREDLQKAVLQLVKEHGLDGLSMRALATKLDTGAMTIYNYVDGRDGLEGLLVEAMMNKAPQAAAPTDNWHDDVRHWAEATWKALRSNRELIPLLIARKTMDLPTLRSNEVLLDALSRGGHSGPALLNAFRAISSFVSGFAQSEHAGAGLTASVKELSDEEFPRLHELADATRSSAAEDELHAGIDLILSGLDSNAPPRAKRRR